MTTRVCRMCGLPVEDCRVGTAAHICAGCADDAFQEVLANRNLPIGNTCSGACVSPYDKASAVVTAGVTNDHTQAGNAASNVFCARHDSRERPAPLPNPPLTGEVCSWCGALLTIVDRASSSPGSCAKCRREQDRVWLEDARAEIGAIGGGI